MLPKMKKHNPIVIHFFINVRKMFAAKKCWDFFLLLFDQFKQNTLTYNGLFLLFFIVLDCQNRMISEINTNTCITFTQPNSTDAMYIKRYIHSLCVFINGEIFPRPSAWNRTFVCDKRDSTLSMCFSNTMKSDAGVFILIVGSVQRNTTTLKVECR